MPFITRPEKYKTAEGHASMDEWLLDVCNVVERMKPYGFAIVLFDHDNNCHSYQYGLRDGDFEAAQMVLAEHNNMTTE